MTRRALSFLAVLVLAGPVAAIDKGRLDRIDGAVEAAIQRGNCPGAVVVVVHGDEVVFRKAYGQRCKSPVPAAMTPDTVFDMASITKPVATATSVMVLIEKGKLRPSDKVAKYWPEFAANGKDDVTVEHCLTHVSGLIPDNSIKDYVGSREDMLKRIAGLSLQSPPGTRFRYSDVGFIVLGELVGRVGGKPVDEFAAENVFAPLKMADTGFKPSEGLKKRTAPTGARDGKSIVGEVHDPRAFALGGVAGHAGLFGTADDLARYCRMLIRGGELDGVRVLSPLTVKLFTEPCPVPPSGLRSRGWDVGTSFSAQRGELFPEGDGFGHTGFTGTSVWVDPPSRTAAIILTSRLHPDEKGNVTELRRQVGTIVASAITAREASPGRQSGEGKSTTPRPDGRGSPRPVLSGIDVLAKEKFARLKGRNVGLVTNHTGRSADGTPTIDLLAKADGVKLVALFSPEHGIRGELDEKVGDTKDEKTGLPVYSLYGERRKPTAETLKGVDTLVYDIQDIGCRFYTYSSTLGLILEAAKENNLKVVVLDRPNPIDGVTVAGPVRDPGRESFVAYHEVPLRHGLTVGEMAKMFNAERKIGADLEVVKAEGWRRGDLFDRTNLPWRNPSPNMRHLTAALVYPGVGLVETTNISVGRGTERPFEWIGAPWIDGRKLAAELTSRNLPGVRFVPVTRTPTYTTHKDKACGGIDIIVDDWSAVRPVPLGLEIALALRKLYPKDWNPKNYDRLLVHKATYEGVLAGKPVAELERAWAPDLEKYKTRRQEFLLYPE
ncbi:MAG TPA: exo-beta-N-acetylmuramidase NamZ domain-containing protein [Gemmataceae bacterium]|nr:exo-beta-N-acetylmuramidase NamZ domain-containing protein [Gemmataceae bacterium]